MQEIPENFKIEIRVFKKVIDKKSIPLKWVMKKDQAGSLKTEISRPRFRGKFSNEQPCAVGGRKFEELLDLVIMPMNLKVKCIDSELSKYV